MALAPQADLQGQWHGALIFELEPGWKTYWRDPGSSGIPPQVSAKLDDRALNVRIDYPMPTWIENDYGDYAGYANNVALPVTLTDFGNGPASGTLSIDIFAGVCAQICVPVTATFRFDVDNGRADVAFSDIMAVNRAREDLPANVPSQEMVRSVTAQPRLGWDIALTSDFHFPPSRLYVSAAAHDGTPVMLKQPAGGENGIVQVRPVNGSADIEKIAVIGLLADQDRDKGVRSEIAIAAQ
jgi:DsbC/DsbD-like thiol-disulfide interchange protein